MATYDNLPVYKTSYDLLVSIFEFVKTFPREYKYTIGEEIKRESLLIIQMIYRANADRNGRKECLREARAHTETLRLYLRLAKDLGQIGLKRFVSLNERLESVSKQLYFWEEKTESSSSPHNTEFSRNTESPIPHHNPAGTSGALSDTFGKTRRVSRS